MYVSTKLPLSVEQWGILDKIKDLRWYAGEKPSGFTPTDQYTGRRVLDFKNRLTVGTLDDSCNRDVVSFTTFVRRVCTELHSATPGWEQEDI